MPSNPSRSLALCLFLLGTLQPAHAWEKTYKGKAGKDTYRLTLRTIKDDKDNNNVRVVVRFQGKTTTIPFPGYAVGHQSLVDLDGDGTDEFLFLVFQGAKLLDLMGVSLRNNVFQALDTDDIMGRDYELLPSPKAIYLGLILQDEIGLRSFEKFVIFKDGKLTPVSTVDAWESAVRKGYLKWLPQEKAPYAKAYLHFLVYGVFDRTGNKDEAQTHLSAWRGFFPKDAFLKMRKKILIYHMGDKGPNAPDILGDLAYSIQQIEAYAKKHDITLLEDPDHYPCAYTLVDGTRIQNVQSVWTGPDLAGICDEFFGSK